MGEKAAVNNSSGRVVVVMGASAGVGRAVAEEFGRRGDAVAVLARGEAGLAGAVRSIESGGGTALAIPCDVADYGQLEKAADQVERELGPIDVWVNVASTSVFAKFVDIEPDEFRRVTEVTYLGYVYGTRVALDRMRPRNRGAIVHVGSALAYRGIPLQSAYCGGKHAIQGFHDSLRAELLSENSGVHVTMVQMPALNTPQFDWVRSRLPKKAQPVPPIYQPEVAARAVAYAADHPQRREYWVGATTAATIMANAVAPGILDRYLAKTGIKGQQVDEPEDPNRPDNLYEPVDRDSDHGAHGRFDDRSHARSEQLWMTQRHREIAAAVGAALVVAAVAVRRGR
jgi:NAD(P)-dependent dehydrogenase (short-subunit alcohol dehydrogenase family)